MLLPKPSTLQATVFAERLIVSNKFTFPGYVSSATTKQDFVILLLSHTHCVKTKRKRVNFESHAFKIQWSVGYFVIELDGKALYLLCSDTVALLKEYSNLWHYGISTHHTNLVKTIIRKLRECRVEYLITAEFLFVWHNGYAIVAVQRPALYSRCWGVLTALLGFIVHWAAVWRHESTTSGFCCNY